MGSGFKENEIVRVQGREHPVIGGRLRIVHELHREKLSIETELVDYVLDQYAVVRARVVTAVGSFSATGTAAANRDPKLVDSLLELAESRACARCLRLAGVGVETCGYEELGTREGLGGEVADRPRKPISTAPTRLNGHRPAPATSAQHRALAAIASRMGRDLDTVVAEVYPDLGSADLTLAQASALIDKLKTKNGNGHTVESK